MTIYICVGGGGGGRLNWPLNDLIPTTSVVPDVFIFVIKKFRYVTILFMFYWEND